MLDSLLVPAVEKDSKRLMLVMHGLGDSMEGYREVPRLLQVPDMNYLLVNAPDHYFGGYSWYDYEGDPAPGVERSREMLFEVLDVQREAGFPTEQTMVFGFSQGCLMTLEVGFRYPHKLAGCIGVSGYSNDPVGLLASRSSVAKEQQFLQTHGTMDPVVPFERTQNQVEQFQAAGMQIEFEQYPKAHTIVEPEWRRIREFIVACA